MHEMRIKVGKQYAPKAGMFIVAYDESLRVFLHGFVSTAYKSFSYDGFFIQIQGGTLPKYAGLRFDGIHCKTYKRIPKYAVAGFLARQREEYDDPISTA